PGPSALLVNGRPAGGLVRYEYRPKLPDAFLVGSTSKTNLSSAIDDIHGTSPFDPASVALVDRPCAACPTGAPGPAGTAGGVAWGMDRVRATPDAASPPMRGLTQAQRPRRTGTVGGQAVPVIGNRGMGPGCPVL